LWPGRIVADPRYIPVREDRTMYSHVTLGTNDFARAQAFYDAVLPLIGLKRFFENAGFGALGYSSNPPRPPQFWVLRPIDGQPASAGNGVTVAFEVQDRAQVDAFHAAALAAGAKDEGKPGLRPHYHRNYYGAYVRDPEGNKLCVVCHRRPEAPAS
jgi:catechol 2,3-dioxygenase-like lactoylglutathione lyase family enzyme